jgi:hypothetical protein
VLFHARKRKAGETKGTAGPLNLTLKEVSLEMKTTLLAIGALIAGSAFAQMPVQKPVEITLGGVFYSGDRDDADVGILAGLDYYMNKAYGAQTMPFVGVRFHRTEQGGLDMNTYGAHIGARYGLPAHEGTTGGFYLKGGIGMYNSDVDVDDKWGVGGFAAIGWELRQNLGLEAGFQFAPSVGGFDNKSFYGAATFRL